MLKRKIYKRIEEFYRSHSGKAMMITGARQVGKSYVIERFAEANYENTIKIDFIEHPEYSEMLKNADSADGIILRMTAVFGDKMIPGKTMIFFDEVQEFPEIITFIKYLLQDGRFDYILSGSLLGTVFKDIISAPVGYIKIEKMYPLDFEEFAWANNVSERVIDALRNSFTERKPVDSYLHQRLIELFELYLITGGMPAVISAYLQTGNLRTVAQEQEAIIGLYKKDISRYDINNKLYLSEIFDLLPSELNSANKRFILKNMNENAKFAKYNNSFLWLKNAGVALPVNLVEEPKTPLLLSKSSNLFKLFSSDVGLLAAQYGAGIQLKILNHESGMNFGAIYENVAAQELLAHGYSLFYYNNKKFGELDFVIEENGVVIPIEIKSGKDYYRHNALNNVLSCKEYNIPEGYVFCNGNIEQHDKITYFPIYMLMFIQKPELPEKIIFSDDFSDLNSLV